MCSSIASNNVNTSTAGSSPPDPTSQPVANQSATSGQTGHTQLAPDWATIPTAADKHPCQVPAGQAWRFLAQRFLGQDLTAADRAVLEADATYGAWLQTLDSHPSNKAALAQWCQTAGIPEDQQQHFTDMVQFEQGLRQQLQAWEEEAIREQGDSPRRIAGSIIYDQAKVHGGPTVLYCRQAYWSYGPEQPCWEQHPGWVDRELPRLTNHYVDAWNAEQIAQAQLTNLANQLAYQNSLQTQNPLPKPERIVPTLVRDNPASKLTVEVLKQLKAHVVASKGTPPTGPFWITPAPLDPDPARIIPVSNGLLDITDPSNPVLLPHTARFFSPNLLPFPYDPYWPRPDRFLRILEDQFGEEGSEDEDCQSKETLLEYLALTLIPELKYQKFLVLIGDPGTGRSTLIDCFIEVLGERNHSSIEVQALNGKHGKAGLIDKLLITFNDSRTADSQDTTAVLQFLLQLVGGDKQHIDPKYKDTFAAKLFARAIMVCNTLPNFRDITNAMERRVLVVEFKQKVAKQNPNLAQEIKEKELPGILNELLIALTRLQQRGHFIQPQRTHDRIIEMRDSASNLFEFLQDCCEQADPQTYVFERDAYLVYSHHARQIGTHPFGYPQFRNQLPTVVSRVWDRELHRGRPWSKEEPNEGEERKRLPKAFYGITIAKELIDRAKSAATFGVI
jgi:P4 family phage/plasmid primase-like protien